MKNKDIEKQLSRSLSQGKQDVWQSIQQKLPDTSVKEQVLVTNTGEATAYDNRRRAKIITLAGALAAAIAIVIALTFILRPLIGGGSSPLPITFDGGACFYVDINPSVQVTLDTEGKVTAVHPLNDDAQVMLAEHKKQLVGKTAEEVAVEIWRLAYNTGYISPTRKNNAVLISGALSDENSTENLNKKLKNKLLKEISANGVYCAVITGKSQSSLAPEAEKYGITASKYALILAAKALGADIKEEEYSDITVSEINQKVADIAEKYDKYDANELENKMKDLAELAEEKAEELVEIIETAIESIEDYIEATVGEQVAEMAEESLERLEDILDKIEERSEDGKKLDNLFQLLKTQTYFLTQTPWATDDIKTKLTNLIDIIDSVEEQFTSLNDDIQEYMSILNKRGDLEAQAQKDNHNHKKSEKFDDEYEDWLEEVYDDYENDWDSCKKAWDKLFD